MGVDGIYKDSNAAPGHTQPSLIVVTMTNKWPDIQRYLWCCRHQKNFPKFQSFPNIETFPDNLDVFQIVWNEIKLSVKRHFQKIYNSISLPKNDLKLLPGIHQSENKWLGLVEDMIGWWLREFKQNIGTSNQNSGKLRSTTISKCTFQFQLKRNKNTNGWKLS